MSSTHVESSLPRPEYPRPDFCRREWLNLNGTWEFAFDDEDKGEIEEWQERPSLEQKIVVPFPYQSKLSGIGDPGFHDVIWYRRIFPLPKGWYGKRILLNFGAVDYACKVWVNGMHVGEHRGGYTPFSFDITPLLHNAENDIVLRVEDRQSVDQPRGKQEYRSLVPSGIFYMRSSGIWQTVWLEPVGEARMVRAHFTPELERMRAEVDVLVGGELRGLTLRIDISFKGAVVAAVKKKVRTEETKLKLLLPHPHKWSPETPNLYDAKLVLTRGGHVQDVVHSYFGMRKISVRGNRILLNNEPCYLRFALDQGFFPDGIYTAPSDDALKRDVLLAKELGFNGVRKHQKVEDPRWLYWCDVLGFLVWGEMANCFAWSKEARENLRREWKAVVERDYNHPSIIVWVPFNECWGMRNLATDPEQQKFVAEIYDMTKRLDPTRLVVDNSGYVHVKTDIVDIHDYRGDSFSDRWKKWREEGIEPTLPRRPLMVEGYRYQGQPIVISEYGGLGLKGFPPPKGREHPYKVFLESVDAFVNWYRKITEAIQAQKEICGFCYTQLYDIEQEVNGLLTYDRKPKVPMKRIAKINLGENA